jgi:hypothetical protein
MARRTPDSNPDWLVDHIRTPGNATIQHGAVITDMESSGTGSVVHVNPSHRKREPERVRLGTGGQAGEADGATEGVLKSIGSGMDNHCNVGNEWPGIGHSLPNETRKE